MYLNNVCASVSGLMCAQMRVRICRFVVDASQCVKCRGLNPSSESNKGGRPLESNRHSFWPRKGSNIFSLYLWEERYPWQRKQQQMINCTSFFSAISLTFHLEYSLTLSDLIPTLYLHCSSAAESISRDASLEKKISFTVGFSFYVDHMQTSQPSPG